MYGKLIDNNEVHFLDIKFTSDGTSVFRKNKHTSQYVHLSSFTPWSYKIAWVRSLINRAYKVCSNDSLLSGVINNIMKFMTWNGFPKRLATKLIQKFTPRANQIYNNSKNDHQDQTVQFSPIKSLCGCHT